MGLRSVLFKWPLFISVIGLSLLSLLILLPPAFGARKMAEIDSVRMMDGSETDFVISGSSNFQFHMFALKAPDRLVIDCKPAILNSRGGAIQNLRHPNVIGMRIDQFQTDVVRVVFDLKRQAKYSALQNGKDLRIRIASKTNDPVQKSPSLSNPGPAPDPSKRDIELSVSTVEPKPVKVEEPENKKSTRKSPVKMKGYLVDKFRRNVGRGQDSQPDMTNSYGLSFKYRDKNKNSTFQIDYEVIGQEYMEPFTDDYMRHDFKIGYEWRLGSNWRLKTVGKAELNPYNGDQYGFRPKITYQFHPRSSFSFYGGHRTKVFRDYRDRIDQDRFLGIEYKAKLIGNQTLQLQYQRNLNDSEKDRYDYVNAKYTASYLIPWNHRVRTLFRLDYSPREYQSRYITPEFAYDAFGTLRQDQGWTFAIVSRFALTKTFEIVPRYVFHDQYSNDPLIDDESLHVPSISLRGRW